MAHGQFQAPSPHHQTSRGFCVLLLKISPGPKLGSSLCFRARHLTEPFFISYSQSQAAASSHSPRASTKRTTRGISSSYIGYIQSSQHRLISSTYAKASNPGAWREFICFVLCVMEHRTTCTARGARRNTIKPFSHHPHTRPCFYQ